MQEEQDIARDAFPAPPASRQFFRYSYLTRFRIQPMSLPLNVPEDSMRLVSLLGAALLTLSLAACGAPKRFVIQGYPGAALTPVNTFTVQSENGWMKLHTLDGKKGKFIPLASGPGAYAGFNVHLMPGKHQLEVSCWIQDHPFTVALSSDATMIEVDGQAGEVQVIRCRPEQRNIRFDVYRAEPH